MRARKQAFLSPFSKQKGVMWTPLCSHSQASHVPFMSLQSHSKTQLEELRDCHEAPHKVSEWSQIATRRSPSHPSTRPCFYQHTNRTERQSIRSAKFKRLFLKGLPGFVSHKGDTARGFSASTWWDFPPGHIPCIGLPSEHRGQPPGIELRQLQPWRFGEF